jgi:hypothetical protein
MWIFQFQESMRGPFGQAESQNAARRSRAYDYEVESRH